MEIQSRSKRWILLLFDTISVCLAVLKLFKYLIDTWLTHEENIFNIYQ